MSVHHFLQEKKIEAFIVKIGAYKNNMLLMVKLISNLLLSCFSLALLIDKN